MIGKVGKCCQMWGISWGGRELAEEGRRVSSLWTGRDIFVLLFVGCLLILNELHAMGGTNLSRLGLACGAAAWERQILLPSMIVAQARGVEGGYPT